MKSRTIVCSALIFCAGAASAEPLKTNVEKEPSISEAVGTPPAGETGGIGFSSLANVTRLYADGRWDILAAGIGIGLSWKNTTTSRFPLEVGLYLAPQFSGQKHEDTKGAVATLLHVTLFKAFGIGAGFDSWRTDVAFEGAFKERFFLTLGYNFTNDNLATLNH